MREIIYCCQDCGNKISNVTALYGKGRCNSCAKIGKLHFNFGNPLSRKTRRKISKALKGRFIQEKCPSYIDGRSFKIKVCAECGKIIKRRNALLCKSCSHKGEKNHNWKNGSSNLPYSFLFNTDLKLKIKKRDGFKCQCCNKTEKQEFKELNRVLTVHHIDYNKMNCKENNLITTCSSCNTKANFNRDYWYAFYSFKLEKV